MVDDLSLDAVAWIRHRSAARAFSVPVAGLDGDAQQLLGRSSHEIELAGVLVGEGSKTSLENLQAKVAAAAEVVFHADVTTALEIEHAIVVEAEFVETAGRPGRYEYRLMLRESPPLPPPAEPDPFGLGDIGLDDLGLDDLGFDDLGGVLDGIADVAALAQDAVNAVNDAVAALDALSSLADFASGSPVQPLLDEAGKLSALGDAAGAVESLGRLLGGG